MERSVSSKYSTTVRWTINDIEERIHGADVVIFARGDQTTPKCGYSKQAFDAIEACGTAYEVVDIVKDPSACTALRAYEGRVRPPAVYVGGKLLTSSDNLSESIASGELREQITVTRGLAK